MAALPSGPATDRATGDQMAHPTRSGAGIRRHRGLGDKRKPVRTVADDLPVELRLHRLSRDLLFRRVLLAGRPAKRRIVVQQPALILSRLPAALPRIRVLEGFGFLIPGVRLRRSALEGHILRKRHRQGMDISQQMDLAALVPAGLVVIGGTEAGDQHSLNGRPQRRIHSCSFPASMDEVLGAGRGNQPGIAVAATLLPAGFFGTVDRTGPDAGQDRRQLRRALKRRAGDWRVLQFGQHRSRKTCSTTRTGNSARTITSRRLTDSPGSEVWQWPKRSTVWTACSAG